MCVWGVFGVSLGLLGRSLWGHWGATKTLKIYRFLHCFYYLEDLGGPWGSLEGSLGVLRVISRDP